MTSRVAPLLTTLGASALLLSTITAKPTALYIWNASESAPIGLYRLRPIDKLAVTELVAVQPPEPLAAFLADGRYLPRGIPLLKSVLALPQQTVCRDGPTVTVDDVSVGEAREHDSRGHKLPNWQGCHVVTDGEVFLMNKRSADSLDGRYFGLVPASAIIGKAEPLWTGGDQ